jgi:hypothetical protein
MGSCFIYNVVNSAERIIISRSIRCLRPDRFKIRSRHAIDIKGMRIDDNAAVFYLFRNIP